MTDTKSTTEHLLRVARTVVTAFKRDDHVSVAAMYDTLAKEGDSMSGDVLRLYDVAQAFLRAILRDHVGVSAVAVREFLFSFRQLDGRALLRTALQSSGVRMPFPHASMANYLVDKGVFRRLGDDHYDVLPSRRDMVREMVDPHSVQIWFSVERVRAMARKSTEPILVVAGQLGCTLEEAADFLKRAPL